MKTRTSLLRAVGVGALFLLAVGGQVMSAGVAEAHGARHVGEAECYGSYQGHVDDRGGPFWAGRLPGESGRDDAPSLSERIGTN